MAKEEQKNVLQESISEQPSDSELFAGEIYKELSERDVFVGDEDFYRLLADSSSTGTTKRFAAEQSASGYNASTESIPRKSFSILQKVLISGIIAIEVMLLGVVLKPLIWPPDKVPAPTFVKALPAKLPIEDSIHSAQEQPQASDSFFPSARPLSLSVARNHYLQENYNEAYVAYNKLYQSLPEDGGEELIGNFLQLKMALCLKKAGNLDQADSLFRVLSRSRSPIVRIVANYNIIFTEIQKRQYLKARTRAYQTIAMIEAVNFNQDWILSLQNNCHFLVAESMTENILSLCDTNADIPPQLWSVSDEADPFAELSETRLRELLVSGSEQLEKGVLSPQIKRLERQDSLFRWSVIAYGASIEELLAKFVTNANLDISWITETTSTGKQARDAIRKRAVCLYLPAATSQQVIEVATGHVGLLANISEGKLVRISDPTDYSSLSEHVNSLIAHTISLWRKYILAFHSGQRIPNAHFAVGLLQAQRKDVADAIAEYKLVANRFSQTSFAPYALLNSSKLRANIHDYAGAREDLTQLIEQYPETEFYGQACLDLADATKNAGLLSEAERLYRKVYNLGLSLELRKASSLGAGKCSYEVQDYETADKWFTQYLQLVKNSTDTDVYTAHFLLGKSSLKLGKLQQACAAFQFVLSGPSGRIARERYVETVSALVETQIQLEQFVDALALLEGVHPWQFSKKESIEISLLKSKVLRLMGLPNKAILVFSGIYEYLPDSQLKTRVSFELADCYIAKGDLEFAYESLADALVGAEPGDLAHEIALKLAEVCLGLGLDSQGVSVCSKLLESDISAQIRQKALKIMASAYKRQKKYDNAALVLSGQWQ